MKQVISGSKTVLVPINRVGRNYFPYIKELQDRKVKYIDISDVYFGKSSSETEATIGYGLFLTLVDKYSNLFYDAVPVENFNSIQYFLGVRNNINRQIILQNCFIENEVAARVGKFVAVTFYWDDDKTTTDKKCFKQLIEVVIERSQSSLYIFKVKFPDVQNIANKRIRSIRPAAWVATFTTPLGYPTINPSANVTISMTLANGNNILFDNLPIYYMRETWANSQLEFADVLLNMQDCYLSIAFSREYDIPTTAFSVPLIVEYIEE